MKRDRQTLPIATIHEENPSLRTFSFNATLSAQPGQFVMLDVYSQGEKPFSILDSAENQFSMTIKNVGSLTHRLFELQAGDLVSIRGPYGKAFSQNRGRVLMVGGGFATPPLRFQAKLLRSLGVEYLVNINGARTEDDLLYIEDFKSLCDRSLIATDDGSLGHQGTSVDVMKDVLSEESFDMIYISGPERMMHAAVEVARQHALPFQVNLERYMKCGVGVCGSCVMDPTGLILCVEGPVIDGDTLKGIDEFGESHRDKTGRKRPL